MAKNHKTTAKVMSQVTFKYQTLQCCKEGMRHTMNLETQGRKQAQECRL